MEQRPDDPDQLRRGGTLAFGDQSYRLLQYHFHSSSEHTIDGAHYPMEMHLVHRDASGGLAVIAVLIEEGESKTRRALHAQGSAIGRPWKIGGAGSFVCGAARSLAR